MGPSGNRVISVRPETVTTLKMCSQYSPCISSRRGNMQNRETTWFPPHLVVFQRPGVETVVVDAVVGYQVGAAQDSSLLKHSSLRPVCKMHH